MKKTILATTIFALLLSVGVSDLDEHIKPALAAPMPSDAQAQVQSALDALSDPFIPEKVIDQAAAKLFRLAPQGDKAFQVFGNPNDWKPMTPYNLSGPLPKDEDVERAIVAGMEFLLSEQKETGQWDVVLTGEILSQTADQAVDAILSTSLAGMALRRHAGYMQERVDAALWKATDFVMDRVIRGKLSTNVYYASWRYGWGMRFLGEEYRYLDPSQTDRREQIRAVMLRMLNSMINMQHNEGEAKDLTGQRRARGVSRKGDVRPATLGLEVAAPTDEDYKGGARITEIVAGSNVTRAKMIGKPKGFEGEASVQLGDRVILMEGARIENGYDFYIVEANFVETQKIEFVVRRGEFDLKFSVSLEREWPADVGLKLIDATGGAEVSGYGIGSTSREAGIEMGDVITHLDGEEITNVASFDAAESKLRLGKTVTIKYLRGGKKKSAKVKTKSKLSGEVCFAISDDDNAIDENGVKVSAVYTNAPYDAAHNAGLRVDDIVTHFDGVQVLGIDHYLTMVARFPANKLVKLKIKRFGEEYDIEYRLVTELVQGYPGFQMDHNETEDGEDSGTNPNYTSMIGKIDDKKKRDIAGIKPGDLIWKIGDFDLEPYIFNSGPPALAYYYRELRKIPAGERVKMLIGKSKASAKEYTIEFVPLPEEGVNDSGGWAYYPGGESPSFTTAAFTIFFHEIKQSMGDAFPVPPEVIKMAVNALRGMRRDDPNLKRVKGYIYDNRALPDLKTETNADRRKYAIDFLDIRGHMGRLMACEVALHLNRKVSKTGVKKSLELWLQYRDELDRVRDFWHTHYYPRWANAAYYWMYGHWHSLKAANLIGGTVGTTAKETILKAMMADRESDGTWLGHTSFGKLTGTAQALIILGEFDENEFKFRRPSTNFKRPITQEKRETEGGSEGEEIDEDEMSLPLR